MLPEVISGAAVVFTNLAIDSLPTSSNGGGEKKRDQDSNDCNYDEQFDQSEPRSISGRLLIHSDAPLFTRNAVP